MVSTKNISGSNTKVTVTGFVALTLLPANLHVQIEFSGSFPAFARFGVTSISIRD